MRQERMRIICSANGAESQIAGLTLVGTRCISRRAKQVSELCALATSEITLESHFLYWFIGRDTTTPSHLVRIAKTNLDTLLHNTNHRWAYVIVSSPILGNLKAGGKNSEETLQMLKDFIGEVYPQIRKEPVEQES